MVVFVALSLVLILQVDSLDHSRNKISCILPLRKKQNGLHMQCFFLSAYSLFIIMFVYCCRHMRYSSCIVTLINIILLSDSHSIYTAPQFYPFFFFFL